jgi:hypothetical protein
MGGSMTLVRSTSAVCAAALCLVSLASCVVVPLGTTTYTVPAAQPAAPASQTKVVPKASTQVRTTTQPPVQTCALDEVRTASGECRKRPSGGGAGSGGGGGGSPGGGWG